MARENSQTKAFGGLLAAGAAMAICLAIGSDRAAAFVVVSAVFAAAALADSAVAVSADFIVAGSVVSTTAALASAMEDFRTEAATPGLAAGDSGPSTTPATIPTTRTHNGRAARAPLGGDQALSGKG